MEGAIIINKFNVNISVNRDGHRPGKVSLTWKDSAPTQRGDTRKNQRLNDRTRPKPRAVPVTVSSTKPE